MDKTVHPFFVRSQHPTSPRRDKVHPAVVIEPQHCDRELAIKAAIEDNETTRSNSKPKTSQRGRKRKDKHGVASNAPKQVLLEDYTQNRVKQAGESTACQEVDASEAVSLEQDLNQPRRKRRKTASPKAAATQTNDITSELGLQVDATRSSVPSSTSWHEQLQAEAGRDLDMRTQSLAAVADSANAMPTTPPHFPSTIREDVSINTSPRPPLCPQRNGEISSPPLPTTLVPSALEISLDGTMERLPRNSGPERKMLRLKGNGRFSSPPSNPAAETGTDEFNSTPPKKRRRRKELKQLVVIFKYRKDESSRISMSREIERILAGDKRVIEERPNSAKAATKAPGPRKPTHPFFLGKPANKAEHTQDTPIKPKPSPSRQSAVTPGKLRAQAQAAHPHSDSQDVESSAPSWTMQRMPKVPGSREAAWPSKGALHVRGLPSDLLPIPDQRPAAGFANLNPQHSMRRKLKGNVTHVPDDQNLLSICSNQLHVGSVHETKTEDYCIGVIQNLRAPERLLTTGRKLQEIVRKETRSRFELSATEQMPAGREPHSLHPALSALYRTIDGYLTSFDMGRCESQSWTQKYAPKNVGEVLQSAKEVVVLRNWLSNLTVTSVVSGPKDSTDTTSVSFRNATAVKAASLRPPKKKRKKAQELVDFIVPDDEDVNRMDELTDPEDTAPEGSQLSQKRSLVRLSDQASDGGDQRQKLANAVLVSGPHGSGKTAAVYAVAKELGFEVFEINAGNRRSGRDVLDRVGDMVGNHIVQRSNQQTTVSTADESTSLESELLKKELESGRQGTMNSFFKPIGQKGPASKPKQPTVGEAKLKIKEVMEIPSIPRQQKQSLILLEEVDILFEEDKNFWMTVLALATQSKRPIIMTCNDENVVPLDALSLHAVLRFSPAPVDLATDYLLLLAAREGHILSRNAVSTLYESKAHDLRASIMELDFWCQMSVGDRKGGLEWMYQRWPPGTDVDEHGEKLRVASKGTYLAGMGWVGHDMFSAAAHAGFDKEHEMLLEAWDNWQIEPIEWSGRCAIEQPAGSSISETTTPAGNLEALRSLDRQLEHLSAADVYCGVGLPTRSKVAIDSTLPPLTEKAKLSFVEGYPLLEADPIIDYANLDIHLAIDAYLHATRLSINESANTDISSAMLSHHRLDEPTMTSNILTQLISRHTTHSITRADFSAAFDPISEPPTTALSHTQPSTHLTPSSFDRPFAILTTDLAPYVRSIAAYDERLEARRLRLSGLLSVGGDKAGKKVRTTRASRSALEGGKRETTRRERWFGKALNLSLVLATGGKGWVGMGCAGGEETEGESVRSLEEMEVGSRSREEL